MTARILLVESDTALRGALRFALELDGFDVTALAGADAALAVAPSGIDCLVIDQALPGMEGLRLLALLRACGVMAPTVLTASTPSRIVRERATAAGVILIEKPLLCDGLSAAIRFLLRDKVLAA